MIKNQYILTFIQYGTDVFVVRIAQHVCTELNLLYIGFLYFKLYFNVRLDIGFYRLFFSLKPIECI